MIARGLFCLAAPASDVQQTEADPAFQMVRAELSEIRAEIRRLVARAAGSTKVTSPAAATTELIEESALSRRLGQSRATEQILEFLAAMADPTLRGTAPDEGVRAVGVVIKGNAKQAEVFSSRLADRLPAKEMTVQELEAGNTALLITSTEPIFVQDVIDGTGSVASGAGVRPVRTMLFA